MSYEGILGHEAAISRLRELVRRKRVAHAYLFAGPSGVGKRLVALAFAQELLGEGPAFGNLKLVQRHEDKKEISIEQVRETIRELSFASATTRVIIVDEAERMSEEAMNAFLKTLEEAPDRAVLILVTAAPAMILPTIRSRCQTILFFALKEEEVLRLLQADTPESRLAAALSGGSAGRAIELMEEFREGGEESSGLVQKILAGDLNPIIEGLMRIRDTGKARRRGRRILEIVAWALRDALRAKAGLPTKGRPAWTQEVDELAARMEILLDHESMIDRNVNVSLAVEDALLRI